MRKSVLPVALALGVVVVLCLLLPRKMFETSTDNGMLPESMADMAREKLERFILSAPTNGLWNVSDSRWTNRLALVLSEVQDAREAIGAIQDRETLVLLLRESVDGLLNGTVARTNEWEELDFYRSSCLMLDALAVVGWETTHDCELVLAIWSSQQRRYREAYERCVGEDRDLKSEFQHFYPKLCELNLRMAKVRRSELKSEEVAFGNWWNERNAFWQKRGLVLWHLIRMYPDWNVGEQGRKLDGGRLYERFKSLTPEQLKEIEDRVRARDKE